MEREIEGRLVTMRVDGGVGGLVIKGGLVMIRERERERGEDGDDESRWCGGRAGDQGRAGHDWREREREREGRLVTIRVDGLVGGLVIKGGLVMIGEREREREREREGRLVTIRAERERGG